MAGFLGGYALVWSGFGALAFGFDLALHTAVDANAGLHSYEWLIGGSVLAVAGAFQFTSLKDACLDPSSTARWVVGPLCNQEY